MRRVREAMGALCLVLAVGGCNDDPEPRFADPTSEAPSDSGDPTSTRPTTEPTSETTTTSAPEPEPMSPEETVRAWVEARNELLSTGNSTRIEALSSGDCATCTDLNRSIVDLYAAGGFVRTEGWAVRGARRKPDFQTSRRVGTAIEFAPGVRKESASAEAERYPGEKAFLDFFLTRSGQRWLVRQVVFLA